MAMTIESVPQGLRNNADDLDRNKLLPILAGRLRAMADAIDANITQPAQAAWRDDVLNALRGLKCPHDGRSGDVYEKAAAHVWGDAIITAMRTVQNLPASPTPDKEG